MFGAAITTTSTAGSSITARQSAVAARRSRRSCTASSRRSGTRVAADDELGVEVALGEQRRDAQQRAAVGLAEPAEADHADADALPASCVAAVLAHPFELAQLVLERVELGAARHLLDQLVAA